jgi:tetratricopeptide (TPR) repeat protein
LSELLLPGKLKNPEPVLEALEAEVAALARLKDKKGLVLVADGSRNQRTLLAQAARCAGFDQIIRVENGIKAIETLYAQQVDMVLSDWETEGWTGVQILDWVRSQPEKAHLFFVLAANPEQERMVAQVAEERHDLFVSKPFGMNILRDRLPGIIERRLVFAFARQRELRGLLRPALEHCLLAVNNNPHKLWPYFSLGGLLGRHGIFEDSARCYQRIQELDRKALAAPLELARLKDLAGNIQGAQGAYSQLIKNHPWFLKSYDALGNSLLKEGKKEQAQAVLERAVNWGGSQHAPRLHKLALLYLENRQDDKALPLLLKSVHLRPWEQGGRKHRQLAGIYMERGQWETAENHARQSLEFSLEIHDSQTGWEALKLWGVIQLRQGRGDTVVHTWSLAFDPGLWPQGLPPSSPRALAGELARLARQEKLDSLARHYYNLAQSLEGKGENRWREEMGRQLAALAEQGLRLVRDDRLDEAEAIYRQGLALDPLSARLCFNLAKVCYRQGRRAQWLRYLRAAERLGTDDEELIREIKRFHDQLSYLEL